MMTDREAQLIAIIRDCTTLDEVNAVRMSLQVQGEAMTAEVYRAMAAQIDRLSPHGRRR